MTSGSQAGGQALEYQRVADELRSRILNGEFRAGDRLPVEKDLAGHYGVGRSTVREALRLLSSQDLLTSTRGVQGGTFVKNPEPGKISEFLEATVGFLAAGEQVTVEELLDVRAILEVPAARMAAQRHDPDEGSELEALALPTEDVAGSFNRNRLFHVTLLKASGNRLLEVVALPVFDVLRDRFRRYDGGPEFWSFVDGDHAEIAKAVISGNVEQAEQAMTGHLERLNTVYPSIYKGDT